MNLYHFIRNWALSLKDANSVSDMLRKAIIFPVASFLRRIGVKVSVANFILRPLGLRFNIPDWGSFFGLIFGEPWMPKYTKLNHQSVVIDIGAHVGWYTVQWAKVCKKVLAFEPHPVNFRYLKENIRMNRVGDRIKAFNVALSNFNGYGVLYMSKSSAGHTLISSKVLSNYYVGECKLKVRKLDDILENIEVNQINLIKIDVEGAELKVLQGSESILRQFKPQLIVEVFHESREAVVKFLDHLGYNTRIIPESERSNYFYLNATINQ